MIHANTVKVKRILSLVLCVVMLLLMVEPMTAINASAETTSNGSRIIVSLGDSYSSGEGIEPFYGQNDPIFDKVKNHDWLAHRSEKSWGGRLTLNGVSGTMAEHRNTNWFFVATSGAKTEHLKDVYKKDYNYMGLSGSEKIDAQLNVFNELGDEKAEYVTVTIGGNDAYFSYVVGCAAVLKHLNPGALNVMLSAIWYKFYNGVGEEDSIRDRIRQAYYDIRDYAGNQAKIIVAGYPKLLNPNGNERLFSKDEATLINDSVSRFNDEIESIVKSCKADGMKICFVSVEEAFEGHGAYSSDAFINSVYLGSKPQDIDSQIASSYSMHPNDKGAQVYADCVQAKIDAIEADGGKTEWPEMSSSDERDIVLVLDVSGSMAGEPLQETQNASEKFIKTILKEDASIGVVTYDNSSMCIADSCMNESYLTNAIQNINSGGGTNIESGLQKAEEMLSSSSAKKKIIVLMSDGQPNDGKVGEELISYADSIKDKGIYIYTLGFFESLGSEKSSAQVLMEQIASDGCHYEVANSDDLIFFFGDVADQINGQQYIYIRIACPTDVTVSFNNETLSSSEKEYNGRTSFGTLTLEDIEGSDDKIKTLRLKEGTDYDIKIEGTGRGRMDYTIGFMDDNGEYSDLRKFKRIPITKKTVIDTTTKQSGKTVLNVDEDGDGKYDSKYRAGENGTGELVDYTYVIYIVLGVFGAILLLTLTVIIKKKITKRKVN